MGSMFLVLVDAHCKWMGVYLMHSIMSVKTIEKLCIIFANHGIFRKVVTDNGPTFTSYEFMQKNGIVHVKSASYHPSCNGLAERAVQILKRGIAQNSGTTPITCFQIPFQIQANSSFSHRSSAIRPALWSMHQVQTRHPHHPYVNLFLPILPRDIHQEFEGLWRDMAMDCHTTGLRGGMCGDCEL